MDRPEPAGTIPILDLLDRLPPDAKIGTNYYEQWTIRDFRAMITEELEWGDDSLSWLTRNSEAILLKATFGVQFEVKIPNDGVETFQVWGKGLPNWAALMDAPSADPRP
jgi:hypothetical protein